MNSETHPPSPLTKKKTATRLRDSGSLRSGNPDSVQAESNGFRRESFSQSRSFFFTILLPLSGSCAPPLTPPSLPQNRRCIAQGGGFTALDPLSLSHLLLHHLLLRTNNDLIPTMPKPWFQKWESVCVIECNQKCTDICYRQVDDEKNEPTTKSLNKDYD